MTNEINSKALEVNLKNTNVEYVIPEEHQWFIKQSENQWGLHKRVVEFFTEYDHPMSNRTEVVKALPNVTISDFWLYKELPIEDQKRIIDIVLAIYDKLLSEKLPHAKAKDLVTYFLRFIDSNDSVLNACGGGVKRCIQILDKYLDDNAFSYYCHIGQFKLKLTKAAENPDTSEATMAMMRRLVKSHIQYWRETTQIMKWYEEHKSKMSRDYSKELDSLGDTMFDEFVSLADNAKNWQELCDNAFTFGDIIKAFQSKERL